METAMFTTAWASVHLVGLREFSAFITDCMGRAIWN